MPKSINFKELNAEPIIIGSWRFHKLINWVFIIITQINLDAEVLHTVNVKQNVMWNKVLHLILIVV